MSLSEYGYQLLKEILRMYNAPQYLFTIPVVKCVDVLYLSFKCKSDGCRFEAAGPVMGFFFFHLLCAVNLKVLGL